MVNSTKEIIVIFARELHKQTGKETDGTKIAQPQKATLTTPTGIQSKLCTPGATTDHGPPARICTQSGWVVKQPKYLKDFELWTFMNCHVKDVGNEFICG